MDEQQYSQFVRYMQANKLMGAVKRESKGRLSDGPRRTYRLLRNRDTHCLVDTGAPINVIDEVTLEKLKPPPKLQACNTRYFAYGEETDKLIPIIGQFVANICYKSRSLPVGFVVVKGQGEHLMSYRTAVELGIVITIDDDRTVNRVGKPADTKPSLQRWSWTLAVDRSGATRFRRSQRCHRDVMRGGLLIRKDWEAISDAEA